MGRGESSSGLEGGDGNKVCIFNTRGIVCSGSMSSSESSCRLGGGVVSGRVGSTVGGGESGIVVGRRDWRTGPGSTEKLSIGRNFKIMNLIKFVMMNYLDHHTKQRIF